MRPPIMTTATSSSFSSSSSSSPHFVSKVNFNRNHSQTSLWLNLPQPHFLLLLLLLLILPLLLLWYHQSATRTHRCPLAGLVQFNAHCLVLGHNYIWECVYTSAGPPIDPPIGPSIHPSIWPLRWTVRYCFRNGNAGCENQNFCIVFIIFAWVK